MAEIRLVIEMSFEVELAAGPGAFARGPEVFGDAGVGNEAATAVGMAIATMQDQAREQSFSQIGHLSLSLGGSTGLASGRAGF